MELAALWISLVTALFTGGATVMAFASRADALSAQKSAEAAQTAAVDAWERSAGALEEANALYSRITEEAIARDRFAKRKELGERVREYFAEECFRIMLNEPHTREREEVEREIERQLRASPEPWGSLLTVLAAATAMKSKRDDLRSMTEALQRVNALTSEWIHDPESFAETHKDDFSEQERAAFLHAQQRRKARKR